MCFDINVHELYQLLYIHSSLILQHIVPTLTQEGGGAREREREDQKLLRL